MALWVAGRLLRWQRCGAGAMLLLGVPGPQLTELATCVYMCARLCVCTCAQLGAEVEAQLYRLLLYDQGSFFVVSWKTTKAETVSCVRLLCCLMMLLVKALCRHGGCRCSGACPKP